jgi:hypothetical protein
MTAGAQFWFFLFAVAALLFFGIALVVTIRGARDLRDLLRSSEHSSHDNQDPPANARNPEAGSS